VLVVIRVDLDGGLYLEFRGCTYFVMFSCHGGKEGRRKEKVYHIMLYIVHEESDALCS
jgi:hypothetical protein